MNKAAEEITTLFYLYEQTLELARKMYHNSTAWHTAEHPDHPGETYQDVLDEIAYKIYNYEES
jgi:hypothetical protein